MRIIALLCLWFAAGSYELTDPVYPPNAVSGGTVVAQLQLSGGEVEKVTVLSGEEPFAGSCKSALARWRLPSGRERSALVVVHFRRPELYYAGDDMEKIGPARQDESLPYPESVVPPVYPANALGKGSVVLLADISAEGRVVGVRVLKSMGILTGASVDAVRNWKFVPARDSRGRKAPSQAYAVLVFRHPVIAD